MSTASRLSINVKGDFSGFIEGLRRAARAMSKLTQPLAELAEQNRRARAAHHFTFGKMLERKDPRWRCECRTADGVCRVVIYKRGWS